MQPGWGLFGLSCGLHSGLVLGCEDDEMVLFLVSCQNQRSWSDTDILQDWLCHQEHTVAVSAGWLLPPAPDSNGQLLFSGPLFLVTAL